MVLLSPNFLWRMTLETPDVCKYEHDSASLVIQTFLLVGIVISYLPQHLRIIIQRSSEGFSPWFLLLGATSASSGLINVIALQWQAMKCCKHVGALSCYESLGGIEIVGLQWFVFSIIFVLYLLYFPPHLKYVEYRATPHPGHPKTCECEPCSEARLGARIHTTPEWNLAVTLSWVVVLHFALCMFITVVLMATSAPQPDGVPAERVLIWTTFLGLCSTSLALIQYTPQLMHTYRTKLVGALSIPAMCIQSPGAALMVYTIAIRPGTNWTSWLVYAVAGCLQATLLITCLFWKARQRRLGIDDFGNPLPDLPSTGQFHHHQPQQPIFVAETVGSGTEVVDVEQREAVSDAVREAVETTPLLPPTPAPREEAKSSKGFFGSLWGRS